MAHENDTLPPRYRNARRIGYGGMGEIFRAEDDVLGRIVAIKVLAERYARDESLRARFTREALAAARLSAEPSTITIFDVGEWRGRPFIVMEHLEGGSLEDRLRDGTPSTVQALDWLEQAAAALDAAHRNGVVHRDVKPGNLLLDHEDSLRVADFGIASAAGMDSLTMTGTVLGTAGYLSPEQAQGERAGPASDRYALGVVAFELLTGRRPFESDSATAEATAHVHAEVPPVSERVDPVFQRALAKDPKQRFGTSAELVRALRDALEPGSLTTRRLAPVRRRSRVPLMVSFVAAAAIAGAGLAAILADRGEGTATPAQSAAPPPPATQPPPPPPALPPPSPPRRNGVALTDQATRLLQTGDYSGAEPIAREAVAALEGTGQTYEAYAEYDLGLALAQLGRCDEALPHLDRSQELQGHRKEIDEARKLCKKHGREKGDEG
jgi:serine/threonine protein kinase